MTSGSADEKIQRCMISTSKLNQVISIKLTTAVGSFVVTLKTCVWLDQLVCTWLKRLTKTRPSCLCVSLPPPLIYSRVFHFCVNYMIKVCSTHRYRLSLIQLLQVGLLSVFSHTLPKSFHQRQKYPLELDLGCIWKTMEHGWSDRWGMILSWIFAVQNISWGVETKKVGGTRSGE